jgi:hypothetical protein
MMFERITGEEAPVLMIPEKQVFILTCQQHHTWLPNVSNTPVFARAFAD